MQCNGLSKRLGTIATVMLIHEIEHPGLLMIFKLPIKLQVLGIWHVSFEDVLPTLDSESFDETHCYPPVRIFHFLFLPPLVCQPELAAVGAFHKQLFFPFSFCFLSRASRLFMIAAPSNEMATLFAASTSSEGNKGSGREGSLGQQQYPATTVPDLAPSHVNPSSNNARGMLYKNTMDDR